MRSLPAVSTQSPEHNNTILKEITSCSKGTIVPLTYLKNLLSDDNGLPNKTWQNTLNELYAVDHFMKLLMTVTEYHGLTDLQVKQLDLEEMMLVTWECVKSIVQQNRMSQRALLIHEVRTKSTDAYSSSQSKSWLLCEQYTPLTSDCVKLQDYLAAQLDYRRYLQNRVVDTFVELYRDHYAALKVVTHLGAQYEYKRMVCA